ncbi:hypothetical protein CERZMDRAFT_99900 [Cercospora zeae-maydis SCOH1-5]|uniref:Uncharacterized protein n=1 Tax=Cercospora zeae-maydis SCOH1-5 TaxID=717836 RepID=A0A6A6F8W9_9PEZI|nr:hypothetical protein CERZMDRAFT_99900 [Cercospora zeae-maydis SCOH1-5]
MAEQVPVPSGKPQLMVPALTGAGAPPAPPMASGGQDSVAGVTEAEKTADIIAEGAEIPFAQPAMSAGQLQPLSQVQPPQQLQAALIDGGASSAPATAACTPVAAVAPSGPVPLPHEEHSESLFVPQGTKHERLDSTELESALKRLKSEAPSSQASATAGFCHQAPITSVGVKAKPITEDVKPQVMIDTSASNAVSHVPTNASCEDFMAQLLSTASAAEATPEVVINSEIPAADPLWPRNKPHVPGFHPNIPKIEASIRDLVGRVTDTHQDLVDANYKDDIAEVYVSRLRQRVQQVAAAKDTETIALLGDMGIGKSEAYEALVGQVGIAIKSDSGRGTHFPIEGHNKKSAQTTPFEITIVWKTRPEFKKTVHDGCQDIYTYLEGEKVEDNAGLENDDNEEENDDAVEPFGHSAAEREYHYHQAVNHLLPLVQEDRHNDFDNGDDLTSWLEAQKANGSDLASVAETLLDRIMTLRMRHGVGASTTSIPAKSAKEATAILEMYSPPTLAKSANSILWERSCHLKKAQLHFDNDMGAEGIVFADVPGRNDPDIVMGELIEEYVRTAHRHLIMAPAGRPITRESDSYLREAIKSKKPTIFVVTKIDVKDDLTTSERDLLSKDQLDEFLSAEAALEAVKTSLSVAEMQKTALESSGQYQQAISVGQQIVRLKEVALHSAKSKLHQLNVEARNRKEHEEIHAQYAKLARSKHGSSDLQVAFISAREYNKHLRGEPALLDYEATGVPTLFRLLYRSIADKRMNKLMQLCYAELPRQLTALKHVLNKSPVQRFQDFKSSIIDSLNRYEASIIPAAEKEVKSWISDYIAKPFTNAGTKARAAELINNWTSGVRSPTFHTSCKKYGTWRDRDWNEDIRRKIAGGPAQRGYAYHFESLSLAIQDASDRLGANMVNRVVSTGAVDLADFLFGHLETELDKLHFRQLPTSKIYLQEVKQCKLDFRKELGEHFDYLGVAVFDIKNNTVQGPVGRGMDSTYVGISMRKTYEEAADVKKESMVVPEPEPVFTARGKPKKVKRLTQAQVAHAKRKEIIYKKLKGNQKSVFSEVQVMVEVDLQRVCAKFINLLSDSCQKVRDALLNAFEGFYVEAGMEENEEESIPAAPLEEAVERALHQLPLHDPLDDEKDAGNPALANDKGDIEKLLEECGTWETLYAWEQQD